MKELRINADIYHLPGTWNQLTQAQLFRVCSLSLRNYGHSDFTLKLLLSITGLKVVTKEEKTGDDETLFYLQKDKKTICLLSSDDLAEICAKLDFLFEEEEQGDKTRWILSSRLTKNIIGPVETKSGLWHGPSHGITNLKTDEYIRAETSMFQYHKTQDEVYLNKLIATLWRPSALSPSSDDIRIPFDDGKVEAYAAIAALLPGYIKQAIYLFYSGSRRFLASRFPNSSQGTTGTDKDIFLLFLKMVNGLANNDVTKHEAVRTSYLVDTMICIDEFARQHVEMEKITKRNRR
jgi:hypothetical protein